MEELWRKVVEFHGHECPGLAIGFKASLAARKYLDFDISEDEEIVCISENDACGVDAIQSVLKCTVGKGNLIIRLTGKSVYHFYSRNTGKSIRLALKPKPSQHMSKEEYRKYLINCKYEDMFEISDTNIEIPQKARIFKSVVCSKCGEKTAEHFARIEDNNVVCIDCFKDYKRFYLEV